MENKINGFGKSRRLENLKSKNLLLDPENPRLPLRAKGKSQPEITKILYDEFDIEEVAYSMAANGYFDEEPLVAVPKDLPKEFIGLDSVDLSKNQNYISYIQDENTKFIVVEGNRRLATIKLLLDIDLRDKLKINNLPEINEDVKNDLLEVPVIIYAERKEVVPYLGVRHLSGIKKWDGIARARYIADMVKQGYTLDEIQNQIGDRKNSARLTYLSLKLIEKINEEFEIDTGKAEDNFSLLMLALGGGATKDFLEINKKISEINFAIDIIPNTKLENLKDLFSWIYGEKDKLPVIKESRDITSKLLPVLRVPEAVSYLRATRDLEGAKDLVGGERDIIVQSLNKANKYLANTLQFISSYKEDNEIKGLIAKVEGTLNNVKKLNS